MNNRNNDESDAVYEYKQNSTKFKDFAKATYNRASYYSDRDGDMPTKALDRMNGATTFAELIDACYTMTISPEEYFLTRIVANAVVTVGSFFSNDCNALYYGMQLKNDITDFAVEKGFRNLLPPSNQM